MRGRIGPATPSPQAPTASHEVAEGQDTPYNWLKADPLLGLTMTDHLVLFHVSTRARESWLPFSESPTAVQEASKGQDRLYR